MTEGYSISWVRHGEAFSNALEDLETDYYNGDSKDKTNQYTQHTYNPYFLYKQLIRKKELNLYSDFSEYIEYGLQKLTRYIIDNDDLAIKKQQRL